MAHEEVGILGRHPSIHRCSLSCLDKVFVVECKIVMGEDKMDESGDVFGVNI